jgi:hypothetical protein
LAQLLNPAGASLGGNVFSTEDGTNITTGAITSGCTNAGHRWPSGTLSNSLITNIVDGSYKPKMAYQNSGTDGRSAGANIDLNAAMTASAIAGTPNPWLTTWITSATPSQNGVVVDATAYDTNDVSWELSKDCAFYSNPITVSSQSRNGRGVTATWAGNLSPSTTYCLRMTTSGQPGQEWFTYGTGRAQFTTLASQGGPRISSPSTTSSKARK